MKENFKRAQNENKKLRSEKLHISNVENNSAYFSKFARKSSRDAPLREKLESNLIQTTPENSVTRKLPLTTVIKKIDSSEYFPKVNRICRGVSCMMIKPYDDEFCRICK